MSRITSIVWLVVGVILMGALLPYALVYIGAADAVEVVINGTAYTISEAIGTGMWTLIEVLIPLFLTIAFVMMMVPKTRSNAVKIYNLDTISASLAEV